MNKIIVNCCNRKYRITSKDINNINKKKIMIKVGQLVKCILIREKL